MKVHSGNIRSGLRSAGLVFGFGLLAGAAAEAAPITFNTALPVSDGEVIIRGQFVFTESSDENTNINRFTAQTINGYGITPKWSVFGVIPLTHIETETGGVTSDSFGLADVVLFSRYEVLRLDGRGATARLAPIFGVRLPTGEDGQTGDGSVDIFGGLIGTIATTNYNLGSQLVYTVNREADGFEAGDTLAFDASLQYRLWPQKLSAATAGFLFGVIEGNVTWQDDARFGGVLADGTGGASFSLSPGAQYATQRWIFDLAVTIPIADSFNNDSIRPDYSVLTSLRVNF